MQDRTLTLIQDDGKEIVCDILFTYHYEKLNKDYVVFQVRGNNEVSAAAYHPTEGGNGSLERIETDEEWELLEDLLEDYSNSLEFSSLEEELREYAKVNNVPIIQDEGLSMLEMVIRLHKPKNILEIGTAIGYSAIRMAKVCGSNVYTIERNETMENEAIKNVEKANLSNQIHLIYKDALEAYDLVSNVEFDMIFIDAAKAQYMKFFNLYTPLLKKGGVVVCDNMAFHGLVELINDEKAYMSQSRSVRGLIRKMAAFHDELLKMRIIIHHYMKLVMVLQYQ